MSDIVVSPRAVSDVIISLTREGSSPARFFVSSTVLCAGSSVFAAMLGPSSHFAEGIALRHAQAAGGDRYIQILFDDDPVALAVILNAMHFQLENMPRDITVEQLMQLAIVCNKYNCAAVLMPFVERWIATGECQEVQKPTQRIQMLFITWVFGVGDEFGELTRTLISKIAFSGASGGMEVCKMLKPPRDRQGQTWSALSFEPYVSGIILDAMVEQRKVIIRAILATCSSVFAKYASLSMQLQCRHPSSNKYCDSLILASLFRGFNSMGILAFDYREIADRSLERLVGEIKGIKIQHLCCKAWDALTRQYQEIDHSNTCDPLKSLVSLVFAEMKKIVPLQLASFRREERVMSWEAWDEKLRAK